MASITSVQQVAQYLRENNIRYVIFDVDLTLTSVHSRGMIAKSNETALRNFVESSTMTDARAVVDLCSEMNLKIGIATFQKECNDKNIQGGTPLVSMVLKRMGVDASIDQDSVITLNSEQYAEMILTQDTYDKNEMIRELFNRWRVDFDPSQTLLVDDTRRNVDAFAKIGGHGIHVKGQVGLQLSNISFVSPRN